VGVAEDFVFVVAEGLQPGTEAGGVGVGIVGLENRSKLANVMGFRRDSIWQDLGCIPFAAPLQRGFYLNAL
jgi:hypothetical protein